MDKKINEYIENTEHILQYVDNNDAVEFAEWTKEKANLRYNGQIPKFPIYNNYIYWCNLGINLGSEQNKLRPVIITRTSIKSSICTVIPLTSKRLNDGFWYHIDLQEIDSTALVEQLRVISKLRITRPFRKKGKLISISPKDWKEINKQLKRIYTLYPLEGKNFQNTT